MPSAPGIGPESTVIKTVQKERNTETLLKNMILSYTVSGKFTRDTSNIKKLIVKMSLQGLLDSETTQLTCHQIAQLVSNQANYC